MIRMRILDPNLLLSAASTVRDGVTDLVDLPGALGDVLHLIGRADALLTRADSLVTRAEDLLARGETAVTSVESMLADGEAMLDRTAGVLADAENAVAGTTATVLAAQEISRGAASVVETAGSAADDAATLLARGEALVQPLEQVSVKALPAVTKVVDHLDPAEVDAMIGMMDRLPRLLGHLEDDILPLLGRLDQVGPDVHDILESVREMTVALAGLPGAGFFKRRGVRKEDEDHAGSHSAISGPTAG